MLCPLWCHPHDVQTAVGETQGVPVGGNRAVLFGDTGLYVKLHALLETVT